VIDGQADGWAQEMPCSKNGGGDGRVKDSSGSLYGTVQQLVTLTFCSEIGRGQH